uniref:Uncharacterized protein n=1 Tax=Suricata suricatta TaxID=37032 RepID=A0A673VH10_SURSU
MNSSPTGTKSPLTGSPTVLKVSLWHEKTKKARVGTHVSGPEQMLTHKTSPLRCPCRPRQPHHLNFGMIVSSALMIWKGLMVISGSESPIIGVLSGSLEPMFHRGHFLFIPEKQNGHIKFLTKGDNNAVHDRRLY